MKEEITLLKNDTKQTNHNLGNLETKIDKTNSSVSEIRKEFNKKLDDKFGIYFYL